MLRITFDRVTNTVNRSSYTTERIVIEDADGASVEPAPLDEVIDALKPLRGESPLAEPLRQCCLVLPPECCLTE